jgi:hypothetical protein
MNTATKPISDCAREGRAAFQQHGVTGVTRHSYEHGTEQREGFLAGFAGAQHDAHARALDEALAYHQLTVRDSAKDRACAERLTAARSAQ